MKKIKQKSPLYRKIKIICKTCGKSKMISPSRKKENNFCDTHCSSKFNNSGKKNPMYGKRGKLAPGSKLTGKNNPNWKGGVAFSRGYKLIKVKNHPNSISPINGIGYIREHRLNMEKILGRYLKKDEVIHHIDGNKKNNNIDNLIVCKQSEHLKFHYKLKNKN